MQQQQEGSFSKGLKVTLGVVFALFLLFVVAPCAMCGGMTTCAGVMSGAGAAGSSATSDSATEPDTTAKSEPEVDVAAELEALRESLDLKASECTQNKAAILLCMASFNAGSTKVQTILEEGDVQQQKQARKLAKDLSRLQSRLFPKMRDAYGPAVRKALWENDMGARTIGKGYRIIEIWGGAFAANRNKQSFQDGVQGVLYKLRFNQSRYRWYKEADEFTYYDMDTPADGDLVVWEGEGTSFAHVDWKQ